MLPTRAKKLQLQIYGQQLTQVDNVIYLSGTISSSHRAEQDINRRVALARGNFCTMNSVWTPKDISKVTKMKVYETIRQLQDINSRLQQQSLRYYTTDTCAGWE